VTSPVDPATSTGAAARTAPTPAIESALKRYRIIAYVVGVMLLLLVGVAMPLKYAADNPSVMNVVGPLHGFLYVVYLLGTFDLGRRVRWGLGRLVLIALAGTIPFLSFYAERKVTGELHTGR
jgi:integral membrane protein